MWRRDIVIAGQVDTLLKIWKKEDRYTAAELEIIKENIKVLDSFLAKKAIGRTITCREKDCLVYVQIIKSTQTMYLYLDAELVDSFRVSTGMGKKYRTPNMSVRPSGPVFIKYTSKKIPAGNYHGLGNMPYAVFIRGGYAIHGTTVGNFSRLGTPASHGCIRLHPENAKLFYELVKRTGLAYTWVSIKDSLP
jgi:lipoprotein-anchoring transpeptidase ErfK/SrfK